MHQCAEPTKGQLSRNWKQRTPQTPCQCRRAGERATEGGREGGREGAVDRQAYRAAVRRCRCLVQSSGRCRVPTQRQRTGTESASASARLGRRQGRPCARAEFARNTAPAAPAAPAAAAPSARCAHTIGRGVVQPTATEPMYVYKTTAPNGVGCTRAARCVDT